MEREPSNVSRRSLIEVFAVGSAFVIDLWVLRGYGFPLVEVPAYCLVVVVLAGSIKRRGGLERILPLANGSSVRAWGEMLAATAIPAVVLLLWGAFIRGPYDELPRQIAQPTTLALVAWAGQHLVWAALQQGVLQLFLRPVIGEIIRNQPAAIAITASVFGLLHLPCPILVLAATFLGVLWMILFRRNGRIFPVIVSHAALSAIAFTAVPPQWNCQLQVGILAQRQQPRYRVLRSPDTRTMLETVTSDDYFNSSGRTDRGFIRSLYRDMLGRTPAEAEVQYWIDHMLDGYSRNRIALEFAGSPEFRQSGSISTIFKKGP